MFQPDSARSTWSTLLSELRPVHQDTTFISSESDFHKDFVRVCGELRERDPQRLLARYIRQHDQIIRFTFALDSVLELDESHCLNSLFWSIAFATFQTALKAQKKDAVFSEYFPRLNAVLPAFDTRLSSFPSVPEIQECLQNVFKEYIECYSIILDQVARDATTADFEAFVERVHVASEAIGALKSEWKGLVDIAAEEEAGRIRASQFSVPNGTFGPLNPDTTYASFELISALGEGTFGQVSKVREGSTGSLYAQKVIHIPDPRSAYRIEKQVKNEVAIMQKLRHHHIAAVQMFVRGTDNFSIIMSPIADCDLLGYLQQDCIAAGFPKAPLSHLTSWFGCLASALSFAHANMIKHEDIKPRNILIKDHQPYLTDFGCAEDFSASESSLSPDAPTFGTPVYWAPEDKPRGRSADVFALGCVFSEMLTVRQSRTLEEYQGFRYVAHKDYGYAFRESLPRVYEWLEQLKKPNDSVGELLVEQTLEMLNGDRYARREAKDIKKALRVEADHVFCRICSY